MTCCLHYGVQLGGCNGSDYRRFSLAGFAPHGGAALNVGIDDDDTLAIFEGCDGGMNGKGGFAAAAFLGEESDSFHGGGTLSQRRDVVKP